MTLKEHLSVVLQTGSVFRVMSTLETVYYKAEMGQNIRDISSKYTESAQELLNMEGTGALENHEIHLKRIIEKDEEYIDVQLIDKNTQTRYSISYVDWADLVDLPIVADQKMSLTDTAAHVLWELTFHGWTREQVLESKAELEQIADQAKNCKHKTISFEDFQKELDNLS